jgi:hypothetical protein
MDMEPPPPGLPGSRPPSRDYANAIDLLGQVIARQGALIAAERSRRRRDSAALVRLQADRAAAIRAALELSSSDPRGLREIVARYRRVRETSWL